MCGGQHFEGAGSVAPAREVLPDNVKPLHYDLTLEPDFTKFTYEGTVAIDLDVKTTSDFISLNTLELTIHSSELEVNGKKVSDGKESYHEKTQTTTFKYDSNVLEAGSKAKLTIVFSGILNDKLAGFYKSTYKDKSGKECYLATTQMEPTDARRAFPCFDEPALKAEYTVTLVADDHQVCLSNMDVASESQVDSKVISGKRKAVKFNRSPLMSTYLLAFIVGDLKYIETEDFRVPIRVYAPPSVDVSTGKFSLDLAAKTLHFYETEFGSPFPLPKMDMVAIPDFAAGAMENWGLVTYRSVDIMYDEKSSGAYSKMRVAEVVQHELAHQWFGNLVTMDFWDGLWLNEGFATWMSWYSCNKFFPDWKIWEGYITDSYSSALALDSLRSSHPIEVPVQRADQVNEIFDAISYLKGSSVIRMIATYLGEDVFMKGIRGYLKKHAYDNTRTEDLWAALAEASGKPVEKLMSIWTKNVGYPVVSVTENEGDKTIKVKQNRFLRTGDVTAEDDKTLYPVFLELKTKNGVNRDLTLSEREQTIPVPDLDFFKINANHSGVYRTAYSPARLSKLGESAKSGLLSVEDRAGMIEDASALAASGYQKTSGILALLKSFDSEPAFVVWETILGALGSLRGAWKYEDEATREALKTFTRELVSPLAHKKGWNFSDSDGHIETQFKSTLFGSAGEAGDEKIIAAAQEMFKKFKAGDRTAISPNIRSAVYSLAVKHGGEDEWNTLLNEFKTTSNDDEKNRALRALGSTRNPELVKKTLALAISSDVKNQDIHLPLVGFRSDPKTQIMLWEWFQANFAKLQEIAPPGLSMFASIVKIGTSTFTTQKQLEEVQAFFNGKDRTGYTMSLDQALDSIRSSAGWVSRDRDDVKAYLEGVGAFKTKL